MVNPAVKKKFRLPRFADQALLNGARAFAAEVEPFVAEFTKHELPPDFLVRRHSSATASFNGALLRVRAWQGENQNSTLSLNWNTRGKFT